MVRIAVAGLGKMGIAHLAQIAQVDGVEIVGVCDPATYLLGLLRHQTDHPTFSDYRVMLDTAAPDAIVIATPSHLHVAMARAALERGIHVFCEKPLTLSPDDSAALVALAAARGLVNQVGYHHRFMGTFREIRRLLDAGVIGAISHASAEARGPVVLRDSGTTWRTRRAQGGGCLFDYATHPIDLLAWYMGEPRSVGGTALTRVFSRDAEDQVHATLFFDAGRTAQLTVDWSDESQRKMSTRVNIWGSHGHLYADRQEVRLFARRGANLPDGYRVGWNTRYITDLTEPLGFYIRGEEYAAQFEHFVARVAGRTLPALNDFASAAVTDRVLALLTADATAPRRSVAPAALAPAAPARRRRSLFAR